jgi:dipeptidyl-peptidase-4
VFRNRVDEHWLPGNTRFWYEVTTSHRTSEYVLVDAEKGERRPAFDHALLARSLRGAGLGDAQPDRLALRDLEWPEPNILCFTAAGKRWRIALENYAVFAQEIQESGSLPAMAPEDAPPWSWRTRHCHEAANID